MLDQIKWEFQIPMSRGTLDRDEVLAWLEAIQSRTDSPIIRECLRCAREEIEHLTSTGGSEEPVEGNDGPDVVEVIFREE